MKTAQRKKSKNTFTSQSIPTPQFPRFPAVAQQTLLSCKVPVFEMAAKTQALMPMASMSDAIIGFQPWNTMFCCRKVISLGTKKRQEKLTLRHGKRRKQLAR